MFLAVALSALGLSTSIHSVPFQSDSLYQYSPYDSTIPRPEEILGYSIGSRHTVLMDQERVVQAIVRNSDRARYFEYGKSTEGRPLRAVAFSSPQNISRLDDIQRRLQALANPSRSETSPEIEDLPALVWINECIHGDETASFESAMALMYNLGASNHSQILSALNDVVVMVNPCYNPDGHERYVVAYNSIPNGNGKAGTFDRAIPWPFMGRANHYRFDMNRDRIAMSQAETRQEVKFLLKWNPQVYADQHGQVENYFMPPVQQSINPNVDRERYIKWTEIFGRATAGAFDKRGWSYYIRDSFDFYAPCYLDSFTGLTGAIGMTHETNGGRLMNVEDRDGFVVTLHEGIEKHVTSALAVIFSSATHREELLTDYWQFKKKGVTGEHAGKFARVVVQGERRELMRLSHKLEMMGVKSTYTDGVWEQKTSFNYWTFATGPKRFSGPSLIIDMAQSMGQLAKAMLEPVTSFENEFVERQNRLAETRRAGLPNDELDSFEFYDLTGWSLPYAHGLEAWICEDTPPIGMGVIGEPAFATDGSEVGYFLPYNDRDDLLEATRMLKKGTRVSLVNRYSLVNGIGLNPGTFLIMKARNPGVDLSALQTGSGGWQPLTTSYPDEGRHGPGSESVKHLIRPEIGIVFGQPGELSGGSLWYLMEQEFRLPFRSLTTGGVPQALKNLTCLVVPDGVTLTVNESLKSWVSEGGSLVLMGGGNWAMGENGFFDLGDSHSVNNLPGSLFRGEINSRSLLSYGYARDELGVINIGLPISGSRFRGSTSDTVVSVAQEGYLSGWQWPNSQEELSGAAWCHSVEYGRGRVTWFADDPTDRAQWPGLWKLLLNSMILGPG